MDALRVTSLFYLTVIKYKNVCAVFLPKRRVRSPPPLSHEACGNSSFARIFSARANLVPRRPREEDSGCLRPSPPSGAKEPSQMCTGYAYRSVTTPDIYRAWTSKIELRSLSSPRPSLRPKLGRPCYNFFVAN